MSAFFIAPHEEIYVLDTSTHTPLAFTISTVSIR